MRPLPTYHRIPLKSDWEQRLAKGARVYPVSNEARAVIDKTFDALHERGRMECEINTDPADQSSVSKSLSVA
jgi:hypothetical protein